MEIVFARVDERLVHGQVMTSWTKQLQIRKIIVCDDDLANDVFTSDVLSLAAPSGVTVLVKSVSETIEMIHTDQSNTKTMLLFKSLKFVLQLVSNGFSLKRLNIGNIGSSPVRSELTRRVFMSKEEKSITKQIMDKGVDVYLQMLYTDTEVEFQYYLYK